MKRIILGDPHGNYKTIEDIYNKEQPDTVIVLGDYCDSFLHDSPEILAAYKKLRKLRGKHIASHGINSFVTLLGNHDWHYINGLQKYSGWKRSTWNAMHDILNSDFDDGVLPIVYVDNINKTIYSHAGLTKTWMSDWRVPEPVFVNECNEDGLNFSHHSFDMYGDSKWQGPLWVRPGALLSDFYGDGEWTQIVGHTRTRNGKPIIADIMGKNAYERQEDAILYVIDTLPFVYIRETLDDETQKRVSRELVSNVEYSEKLAAQ